MESSDPPAVPRPVHEKSVATDGPTLAFRRWYFDAMIDGRSVDVPVSTLVRSRGIGAALELAS